jgi:hypothetical protein
MLSNCVATVSSFVLAHIDPITCWFVSLRELNEPLALPSVVECAGCSLRDGDAARRATTAIRPLSAA